MNQITVQMLSRQYYHEMSNALKYQKLFNRAILEGLTGVAKFFNKQAADELCHAQKVSEHIKDMRIPLMAATLEPEIDGDLKSLLAIFEYVLQVEQSTTAMLMELSAHAMTAGDALTFQWLNDSSGLLKEQTEEEYTIKTIIARIQNRMESDTSTGGINHDIDTWIEQEFCA